MDFGRGSQKILKVIRCYYFTSCCIESFYYCWSVITEKKCKILCRNCGATFLRTEMADYVEVFSWMHSSASIKYLEVKFISTSTLYWRKSAVRFLQISSCVYFRCIVHLLCFQNRSTLLYITSSCLLDYSVFAKFIGIFSAYITQSKMCNHRRKKWDASCGRFMH